MKVDEYAILESDDHRRTIRIEDAVREEVGAALRLAPATAQDRIDTARLLRSCLTRTYDSLALGEVSPAHVRVVVEAAGRLPGRHADPVLEPEAHREFAAACEALQDRVLRTARRATVSMTRAAANRAVLAIDAEGQRRRREQAKASRDVYVVDDVDGMALLIARLSTEHAYALRAVVDATARAGEPTSNPGPLALEPVTLGQRTIGERRADALLALVLGMESPVRAEITVTVPLDSLTGAGDEPADLGGGDMLSAEAVRDLLMDPQIPCVLRRLVTDPLDGTPLDYGRTSYEVPARLRRVTELRDRTCRFPGCRRRATSCQVDHAVAWSDEGETNPGNLGLLCVRHHQLKTHGGWDIVASGAEGTAEWRSPQGRRYERPPAWAGAPPPF